MSRHSIFVELLAFIEAPLLRRAPQEADAIMAGMNK